MRKGILLLCFLSAVLVLRSQNSYILVLGIAQDGGYPHAGCNKKCCKGKWDSGDRSAFVSSLAYIEPFSNRAWIFDAGPDFAAQLDLLKKETNDSIKLAGIFITHAHIGHYTGLMQLGREVMNSKAIPVYTLPRMKKFLEENGPWSQLVKLGNIRVEELAEDQPLVISSSMSVTAFTVPHRDEYSETAGFLIRYLRQSALFIPDIDKWQLWKKDIKTEIRKANLAFIDATFYSETELPGRNMKEIPHPLVSESMQLFESLPANEKARIKFIHLNHSNPLLQKDSPELKKLNASGFEIAEQGKKYYFR